VVRRGSDEEKDLTRELADLQQQSAEQEIARQEQVKQARLEALERANEQAELRSIKEKPLKLLLFVNCKPRG
jgi:predicted outer membrane protein